MKLVWCLWFPLCAFLICNPSISSAQPSCLEYTSGCNEDFDCIQTVIASMVSIHVFCKAEADSCEPYCDQNLRTFLGTSFGYDLMTCDCSQDPGIWVTYDECQHGQKAANFCISDIESYKPALTQCELDFLQCERQTLCLALWESYLYTCAGILDGGTECETECPVFANLFDVQGHQGTLNECDCDKIPGPWCFGDLLIECVPQAPADPTSAPNTTNYLIENGGDRAAQLKPLLYCVLLTASLFLLPF